MTPPSAPSPRDARLDVARGIGVLLVLYAHSLEPLFIREDTAFVESAFLQWRYVYSFHMPLFFLLSGAARGRPEGLRDEQDSPWRVLREALALLLFVQLGQLFGGVLNALDLVRQGTRELAPLLKPVLRGTFLLCDLRLGILWYLVSLAIVTLLAQLWRSRRPWQRACVLAVCTISLVSALPVGPAWDVAANWFQIRSLMPGLLFFAAGRALAGRFPPLWLGLLALAALAVIAPLNLGCPFNPFDTCPDIGSVFAPWMILGRHGFLPLFYLCAALGCVGVLGVAPALRSRALAYLGRVSLQIYMINAVFLEFVLMKLSRVKLVDQLGPLGYVAIFAGTLAIHLLALLVARRPIDAARAACARWAQALVEQGLRPLWQRASQQPSIGVDG